MSKSTPLSQVAIEQDIVGTSILHLAGNSLIQITLGSIQQFQDVLVNIFLSIELRSRYLESLRARNVTKQVGHDSPIVSCQNLTHSLDIKLSGAIATLFTLSNHLLNVVEVKISTVPLIIERRSCSNLIDVAELCILKLVVTCTQDLLCIRSNIPGEVTRVGSENTRNDGICELELGRNNAFTWVSLVCVDSVHDILRARYSHHRNCRDCQDTKYILKIHHCFILY